MNPVVAWLLALALQFAPPERSKQLPGWEETVEQRTARYAAIAEDIWHTVKTGRHINGLGKRRTAALMLAVAIGESGLDPDTDKGPCYRGGKYRPRCDYGHAASMWQIKLGRGKTAQEGWGQADLFADRRKAAAVALRGIRGSWWMCRRLPEAHRLAAYGSGTCRRGHKGSAARIRLWYKLMAAKPLPKEKP
jgi:hypothetical protein